MQLIFEIIFVKLNVHINENNTKDLKFKYKKKSFIAKTPLIINYYCIYYYYYFQKYEHLNLQQD